MEVIKIQATIKGGILPIPDRILSQIGEGENVEIVFRPLRSDASTGKDVNQVIDDLEKQFQGEFPNLRSPISHNSYAQALAARMLGIPFVTSMDYEHQPANQGRWTDQIFFIMLTW